MNDRSATPTTEPALELVGTTIAERRTEEAVRHLFERDGTVYLITGFFTANAYRSLRADILSFLHRSADNDLVVVVGAGADQFSAAIARDLWKLETPGRVRLYRYPRGFLHAKLYVRAGPSPVAIIGSANLTRVAFEQNLEVGAVVHGQSPTDPTFEPFLEWIEEVVEVCEPLRERDLSPTVRLFTTFRNWSKKGQLLPVRRAARRAVLPVVGLLTVVVWRTFGLESWP